MEELELSDVIANAVIQKGRSGNFCNVYLMGITERPMSESHVIDNRNLPKVCGLRMIEDETEYNLKERAYMVFMGRIQDDEARIQYRKNQS